MIPVIDKDKIKHVSFKTGDPSKKRKPIPAEIINKDFISTSIENIIAQKLSNYQFHSSKLVGFLDLNEIYTITFPLEELINLFHG